MTARYIVLLGAPGSGKGTQAGPLAEATGLVHLSSGDLFRENIKNATPLGLEAKGYIDRGDLVPDQVTINMIFDRIAQPDAQGGAILDGFPRTLEQARSLDNALKERGEQVNTVLLINVRDEELLERLSGRWICSACGSSYHTKFNPPKTEGKCDKDGTDLYQRPDDTREKAEHRLGVYNAQTVPLVEYYKSQNKLAEINGEGSIDAIGEQLRAAAQNA